MAYANLTAEIDGRWDKLERALDAADTRMRNMTRNKYEASLTLDTRTFQRDVQAAKQILKQIEKTRAVIEVEVGGSPVAVQMLDNMTTASRRAGKAGQDLTKTWLQEERKRQEIIGRDRARDVEQNRRTLGLPNDRAGGTLPQGPRDLAGAARQAQEVRRMAKEIESAHSQANRLNAAIDRGQQSSQRKQGASWARQIEAEMKRAGNAVDRFGEKVKTTSSDTSTRFGRVLDSTLAFTAASAILNSIAAVFGGLKNAVVDFNATQEQTLTGLQTQLGGSSTKATALYLDLQKLNDLSPFREEDILPNAQKFLAAKLSVNDLKDALRGISEQTSALGGDSQKFSQIATAINQIWIKPRLGLEELTTQLVEHGVPAFDLLAKAYKTNSVQIQEWISKGMIPGKEAARALWNQMERQNFGASAKQAKTFTGALSTLADITNRRLGGAFKSSFDRATVLLNQVVNIAQNKEFQRWAADVGKWFKSGFTLAVESVKFLVKTTLILAPLAIGAMTAIGARALWLGRTAIFVGVANGVKSLAALRVAFLATAGSSVVMAGVVGVALAALATDFMGIRSTIIDGWKSLTSFIARQYDGIMKFLGVPMEGSFEAAITATMPDIDKFVSNFKSSLQEKLKGADFGLDMLLPGMPDLGKWAKGAAGATGKLPDLYIPKLGEPKAEEKGKGKGGSRRTNKFGLFQPEKGDQDAARYNESIRRVKEEQKRIKAEQKQIAPMSLSKLRRIGGVAIEPNAFKLPAARQRIPLASEVDATGKFPTAAEIMKARGQFINWRNQRNSPQGVGSFKEYGRIQEAALKAQAASELFARSQQAQIRVLRDGAAILRANGGNTLEYGKTLALAKFKTDQWSDSNVLAMLKADNLNKTYTASAEVNKRVALETQRLNTELRSNAFADHTQRVTELDREYAALGDKTVQMAAARRMANREDFAYLTQAERVKEVSREIRNEIERTTRAMVDGSIERAREIRRQMEDAKAVNPLERSRLSFSREDEDNARRGVFLDLGQSMRVAVARAQEIAETTRQWRADGLKSSLDIVNEQLKAADLTAARVAETISSINKGVSDRTLAPTAAIGSNKAQELLDAAFNRTRARASGDPTGLESWGLQLDSLTQQIGQFRTAQSAAFEDFASRNNGPIEQAMKLRKNIEAWIPAFKTAAIAGGMSIGQISSIIEQFTKDLEEGVKSAEALAAATGAQIDAETIKRQAEEVQAVMQSVSDSLTASFTTGLDAMLSTSGSIFDRISGGAASMAESVAGEFARMSKQILANAAISWILKSTGLGSVLGTIQTAANQGATVPGNGGGNFDIGTGYVARPEEGASRYIVPQSQAASGGNSTRSIHIAQITVSNVRDAKNVPAEIEKQMGGHLEGNSDSRLTISQNVSDLEQSGKRGR